jgi:hypothetical protein
MGLLASLRFRSSSKCMLRDDTNVGNGTPASGELIIEIGDRR